MKTFPMANQSTSYFKTTIYMFYKYEFKNVTQLLSMNQKYQSSIIDLHKYKEQMLRCSRNETISKFENFFDNLILHVFTTILLSHYYFEVGLVAASFSSTTLLGFVSFLIYIKFIFYKLKTIVRLFVVV